VSKFEYCLWGADFMIAAIGWSLGGPWAGLLCLLVGASLIFIGLTKRDAGADNHPKTSGLIDFTYRPYPATRTTKAWHKWGLAVSLTCLVVLGSYLIIKHAKQVSGFGPQVKPDLMVWIVNPIAPQLLIWPLGTLAKDVRSDPLLWDIDRDDTVSSTSLIINEMKYDWIRTDQHGGPSPLLDQRDIQNVVKPGHHIFGYVTVACPDCDRIRLYWVYFVYGQGGWFAEIPRGVAPNPKAIGDSIPSLRAKGSLETILANITPTSRITIEDESQLRGRVPRD